MAHRISAFLFRHPYLFLGYDGPCERGAEKIRPFVNGVGPEGGKDIIFDKDLFKVGDDNFFSPGFHAFLADRIPVLLLTDICGKGNDRAVVGFFEPFQNH